MAEKQFQCCALALFVCCIIPPSFSLSAFLAVHSGTLEKGELSPWKIQKLNTMWKCPLRVNAEAS